MTAFWDSIARQLNQIKAASTADDVIRALSCSAHATKGFFAGSGGDDTVMEALEEAGWSVTWAEADYFYVMRAPNGDEITYVEGDVFIGNQAVSDAN